MSDGRPGDVLKGQKVRVMPPGLTCRCGHPSQDHYRMFYRVARVWSQCWFCVHIHDEPDDCDCVLWLNETGRAMGTGKRRKVDTFQRTL